MLTRIASERLAKLRAQETKSTDAPDPIAFVPIVTPRWEAPEHLRPYGDELAEPIGRNLRLVVAAPPQHGKTVLTVHALLRLAIRHPGLEHAYVTFNQSRADEVAIQFQRAAEAAGQSISGPARRVQFENGSAVKFTSIGGTITGAPVSGLLVIDDPIKDREEAESALKRDRAWNWWTDAGETRVHPGGGVVVMATRWHVDDLSGRLIKAGWRYINLKAIADGRVDENGRVIDDPLRRAPGEALWPEKRPAEWLEPKKLNAYTWASLYQGEPRPRGGAVFGPPHWYKPEDLPRGRYRQAHGIDLAYTKKSHADFSVCWTMLRFGDLYYVVDVKREQVRAPQFADTLKRQAKRWPGRFRWYGSTTEVGAGELLADLAEIPINSQLAVGDKFLRAQPLAAAWNDGRVLLPSGGEGPAPEWVNDVVDEFADFTGVADRHDDIVDAGAACFDELDVGMPMPQPPNMPPLSRWDGFDERGF